MPLALAGTAAVPWTAFVEGHPFRIRYMVPLDRVEAIGVGAAGGDSCEAAARRRSLGRAASLLVAATSCVRSMRARRWSSRRSGIGRTSPSAQQVTACLRARYGGETIMASMGSLGHYMQELSRAGFSIRDFLHEGNGDIWLAALDGPRPYAGWMLIEEKAEGGDMLAQHRAREPDVSRRVLARVRRRGRRALPTELPPRNTELKTFRSTLVSVLSWSFLFRLS